MCAIHCDSTSPSCLQVRQAITAHQQAVKLAGQGALPTAVATSQAAREVVPKCPFPFEPSEHFSIICTQLPVHSVLRR